MSPARRARGERAAQGYISQRPDNLWGKLLFAFMYSLGGFRMQKTPGLYHLREILKFRLNIKCPQRGERAAHALTFDRKVRQTSSRYQKMCFFKLNNIRILLRPLLAHKNKFWPRTYLIGTNFIPQAEIFNRL